VSSESDLTARARIRQAAIVLFADKGIEGATVRDIAQAAGVSSGLLRHHFGSKEGLRDACDEYALSQLTSISAHAATFQVFDRVTPEVLLWQRYMIRSLMDGSPTAAALFDRLIEYGERWLASSDLKVRDQRAFVAVLSVMKLSLFTMRDQLSRVLGVDTGEPEGWVRMLKASVEVFSQQLVTPEHAEMMLAALDRVQTPEE
jgi:AcrR family transcriptional regulator